MLNLRCVQKFFYLDLDLVCKKYPHHLSEPLVQLLEDNEIFHSPTLRRGVKWGRVLCCHATLWDNEIFLLSASSSRSGMKIGKINTRRARGEERWGYLARTISHLFPFFISHRHKECFGRGQNQLWAGTGHTNWFTALGQKCVVRSTCLKK